MRDFNASLVKQPQHTAHLLATWLARYMAHLSLTKSSQQDESSYSYPPSPTRSDYILYPQMLGMQVLARQQHLNASGARMGLNPLAQRRRRRRGGRDAEGGGVQHTKRGRAAVYAESKDGGDNETSSKREGRKVLD